MSGAVSKVVFNIKDGSCENVEIINGEGKNKDKNGTALTSDSFVNNGTFYAGYTADSKSLIANPAQTAETSEKAVFKSRFANVVEKAATVGMVLLISWFGDQYLY